MKATSYLKSAVTRGKGILCGMLLAAALGIGLTGQIARASGNPNPGVIPPHARGYGLSYAEWGAQWWRWAYSFPVAQFPPLQSGSEEGTMLLSSERFWPGENIALNETPLQLGDSYQIA